MYQHLQRNVLAFTGVQSYDLVDPTAPVPDATLYPKTKAGDRLGIGYDPRNTDLEQEILTAQQEWRYDGQKLSYEMGSASCRERCEQYVKVTGVGGHLQKKTSYV